MPPSISPIGPGVGPAWQLLALALRDQLPIEEIDGIWVFRPIRNDTRDWGTAIISRVSGDRRRIYTARFIHTVKGKKRGAFDWHLDEVGTGPVEALEELLALVPVRADEDDLPIAVNRNLWFPPLEEEELAGTSLA